MKFYHELSDVVLALLSNGLMTVEEVRAAPDIAAAFAARPDHPSGGTPEQLGLPPRPPGFPPLTARRSEKHELGTVLGALIHAGSVKQDPETGKLAAVKP